MRPENPLHELPMKFDDKRATVWDNHLLRSWVATVTAVGLHSLRGRGWSEDEKPLITLLGCRPDLDENYFRLASRDFATLDCDSDPCFRAVLTLLAPKVDVHREMRLTVTGLAVEGFRVDHASYSDSGPSSQLIPEGRATAVRVELYRHPWLLPYRPEEEDWPEEAYQEWRGIG